MGPRTGARAVALVLAFGCIAPGPSDALTLQHLDDVRNGYRALTTTFYRGVAPSKLIEAARGAPG
jgi:hypothetical protein